MISDLFGGVDDDDDIPALIPQQSGEGTTYQNNKVNLYPSYVYSPRSDSESNLVGILNQGATCYLNTLLQTLYMTPEFRFGMYSLPPELLNISPDDKMELSQLPDPFSKKPSGPPPAPPPPPPPPASASANSSSSSSSASTVPSNVPNTTPDEVVSKETTTTATAAPTDTTTATTTTTTSAESVASTEEEVPALCMLVAMGFDEQMAQHALDICNNNVDHAANWLLSGATTGKKEPSADIQLGEFRLFDDLEVTDDVEPAQKSAVTTNVGAEPSSKQENSPPTTSASPSSSTQAPSQTTQTDASPVSDQADPGNPRQIVIELQRLFAYLQEVDQIAVSTNPLTKSFGWENSEASQQQDVHELNRLLFEVIEESLVGTPQQNIIENLYKGTTTTQLCCLTCGNTKEHVEPFQDIPIIVHGFDSLEQSLQALTNWEPLTKENQYSCDQCGKKVDGKKGVRITQVPDILVLPLQRFEYNFKQQRREKINTSFQFPLVLDLAPFTKIMDDPGHTPDPLLYDLFAVLIHSGGAYGGHYHAMIRDITRKGEQQWFDFNDSSVTPIPELQLESTFGGSKECAYMLTYRRKSKDFVHTPVPEHCLKEIRCHNEKLKQIRVEHDTAVNQMYINVWGEAHLTLCDGVLTVNKEEKENEKVVFFDARQPLEALFKMVAEIPWLAPVLIGHYQLNEMWETTSGVVRINQLLCTSDDDKTLPIKKTPIRPASSVIVWNGKMISGMLYNPEQPSVLLMLSWKHSKNEGAARARIGIPLNSTLTDLRQKLHQLTGIPPHQQIITKVDRGKRVRLVEEKATIFESKLFDSNEVFLESVLNNEEDSAPKSSTTDAPIQIPDDTDMTIYITDWCTPIQPALSRSIVVPKDSTVAFLKKRVIDSVPLADYTVETTVLRRCLVGGAPGESLEDAIQLTSAGISDSMRLIIEPGTPATGVYSVNVKWNVPALGETPASQTVINLLIPKTTTLAECKELAAQQIGIDASSVRLRKSDIFEMPADLVVDEAVPLDRAGVIDGGYIFLEKGKPLTKGEALVCFQLFDYLPAEESQNSSYETMYSGHFSPLLILSSRNSKNTDSRNGGHSKYINLLGEAQVPLSTTVGELLDTTIPPLLPPNPSGNKPIFRLWQGSKLLRKMSQSLKQLQVGYSDALLTIQLVNESVDPIISLGADSILLYCCCRDPKSGLFHPNQEIVITTPTLGLLRTLLATKYDIEDKNLLLARCAASAARWSQIVHQQSETTEITAAPQITPDTAAKTTTTAPETPPAVTETPTDNRAPPTESPATGGTAETPANNSSSNTNKNKGKNQQQKQNQRGNAQTGAGKGGKGQQQARRPVLPTLETKVTDRPLCFRDGEMLCVLDISKASGSALAVERWIPTSAHTQHNNNPGQPQTPHARAPEPKLVIRRAYLAPKPQAATPSPTVPTTTTPPSPPLQQLLPTDQFPSQSTSTITTATTTQEQQHP